MTSRSLTREEIDDPSEMVAAIDVEQLPHVIQQQIAKLNELDSSVKNALNAAAEAEKRADAAKKMSAGRGLWEDKKKAAIEGLQSAGVELAQAVQIGANAQKISFEFQTRLAEVTKYLFNLGAHSIAARRYVVRELEMRLSGASREQLSELAHQELLSVVRQLKEQEDLLEKQARMQAVLRDHDERLAQILERGDAFARDIEDEQAQLMALRTAHGEASDRAFARIDALARELEQGQARQLAHADGIQALTEISAQQRQALSALEQQASAQRHEIDRLAAALAAANANSNVVQAKLRWTLNLRTAVLAVMCALLAGATFFFR